MVSLYCTVQRLLGGSVVRLIVLLTGNIVVMLSELFFPDFIKGFTVDALVGRRAGFEALYTNRYPTAVTITVVATVDHSD